MEVPDQRSLVSGRYDLLSVHPDVVSFLCRVHDSPFRSWISQSTFFDPQLSEIARNIIRFGRGAAESSHLGAAPPPYASSSSFNNDSNSSRMSDRPLSFLDNSAFVYCPFAQFSGDGAGLYVWNRLVVVWDGSDSIDVVNLAQIANKPACALTFGPKGFSQFFLDPPSADSGLGFLAIQLTEDSPILGRLFRIHSAVNMHMLFDKLQTVTATYAIRSEWRDGFVAEGSASHKLSNASFAKERLRNMRSKIPVGFKFSIPTVLNSEASSRAEWMAYQQSCQYFCGRCLTCFATTPVMWSICDSASSKEINCGTVVRTGCCGDKKTIVIDRTPFLCVSCGSSYEIDIPTQTLYQRTSCSPQGILCFPFIWIWPVLLLNPPLCNIGCRTADLGVFSMVSDDLEDPEAVKKRASAYYPSSQVRFMAIIPPPPPVPMDMGIKSESFLIVAQSCCCPSGPSSEPDLHKTLRVRQAFSELGVYSSLRENLAL
eukprot:ANDGO_00197.mRNA.1 hypothetical protein